jgi:predicted permease
LARKENFNNMIEILHKFLIPVILVVLGIWLKKGHLPNTKSEGKLWLLLVIVGCVGVLLNVLLLIIRS